MLSMSRKNLISSLPICIPLISISCLVALVRTSRKMLNRSGKNRHPCLVPSVRGKSFSFSPLSKIFAVGFFVNSLKNKIEEIPFYS